MYNINTSTDEVHQIRKGKIDRGKGQPLKRKALVAVLQLKCCC